MRTRVLPTLLLAVPLLLAGLDGRALRSAWADGKADLGAGYAAAKRGDLEQAIELFGKAIEAKALPSPTRALAYLNRGNVYADQRRFEEAMADYEAALALAPDLVEAHLSRGRLYEEGGLYDQAIADYAAIVALQPKEPAAYDARARAYFEAGQLKAALADFNTAISLAPIDANLYDRRGLVYYNLGDVDKAFADFSVALQIRPDHAEAYRHRGVVYHARGEFRQAVGDFDQAIRLEPDNLFAYGNRGRAKYLNGQFAAAADDFTRVVASPAADLYTLLWLHLAHLRSGRKDAGDLAEPGKRFDLAAWPGPIARFFLGQLDLDHLRAAAKTNDAHGRIEHACDLGFYVGEAKLAQDARDEARALLAEAAARCPKGWAEHVGAAAELKRLGS
jgi:lipoprotein NlpI